MVEEEIHTPAVLVKCYSRLVVGEENLIQEAEGVGKWGGTCSRRGRRGRS